MPVHFFISIKIDLMARPEKNNVEYFPFICEDGKKMFYIEETYGNDGFATFVKLLRELAKADNHYLNLSSQSTVMFLSAKCKVSKEKLISIVNDLVELGKFDKVLWNENSIIWCQDFVDSIQDAYKKRINKCITYDGLLSLLVGLGIRKQDKSTPKVSDNPQTKEEETKEEETKENESDEDAKNRAQISSTHLNEFKKLSIDDCRKKYDVENVNLRNDLGAYLHIKPDEVIILHNNFDLMLKTKEPEKQYNDYTRHFSNWARKLPPDELKQKIKPVSAININRIVHYS